MPPTQRATLALLVVALIWGWTFVWMKQATEAGQALLGADNAAVYIALFMMLRFLPAAFMIPAFSQRARQGLGQRGNWQGGAILAGFVLAGFLLQMFGLEGVSPAVSAFLTSLYVPFTALLGFLLGRRGMSKILVVGVLMVTLGASIISGPPQLNFDLPEWLTVLCGLFFAGHILSTDYVTKRHDPLTVTATSFFFVGIGCLALFAVQWRLHPSVSLEQITQLLSTASFAWPLACCCILGTAVALSLLNYYQRELDPVRAAILFSLEPVFAAIISLAYGKEELSSWFLAGSGLVLLGNVAVEVIEKLKERKAGATVENGGEAMENGQGGGI
ncbi:MAG: hypothetical protein CMH55_06095 [Myxococcales bacterium]|nr:hypothetical protein [Myxococcales bacterium]